MEKFKLISPTKAYEQKAIEYIEELKRYDSPFNGTGGLYKYLDDYDAWLVKLDRDRLITPNEKEVPKETFFLTRTEDDKILGMITIRLVLNESLKKHAFNIGYSIRPTERLKGYNKINLYLGLKECQKRGLKEVWLDCTKDNLGSSKTIEALGGTLEKEYFDDECDHCMTRIYKIDVDKSLRDHKNLLN